MPIIHKLIEAYKIWQENLIHFPTTSRHTLGFRIDTLIVEIAEILFTASFSNHHQKQIFLQKASNKLDSVKFLLRMSWEIKSVNDKKYILMSEHFEEIGKMLGGWLKQNSPK